MGYERTLKIVDGELQHGVRKNTKYGGQGITLSVGELQHGVRKKKYIYIWRTGNYTEWGKYSTG